MVKKLDLYMESGIKEYWIVNPLNQDVTIYHFEGYEVNETRFLKTLKWQSHFYSGTQSRT